MKPEHMHNMTDAEFIRWNENTDDPRLKEAVRRLEVAIAEQDGRVVDAVQEAAEKIRRLQAEVDSLEAQLDECDEECQRLQRESDRGY